MQHIRNKIEVETFSNTPALHVTITSPEIAPFAKTGGLADVLGSLPGIWVFGFLSSCPRTARFFKGDLT
jgi:hypothetical protein